MPMLAGFFFDVIGKKNFHLVPSASEGPRVMKTSRSYAAILYRPYDVGSDDRNTAFVGALL